MTKRSLIKHVASHSDLTVRQAHLAVDLFLEALAQDLVTEGQVGLRGFGSWRVVEVAARVGRNPQTGAPVQIEASRHIRFRMSKALKNALKPGGRDVSRGDDGKGVG